MSEEMEWNDLDMVVDDAEVKDSESKTDFVILPKGEYPFIIAKVEFKNYQPKPGKTTGITKPCKQIVLGIVVDGGDKGSAWVDENLYFYPTCMYKILSVFKSVGLISDGFKGTLPWDQLKGSEGRAKFEVEKYHSTKYGEDRERMIAKTFLKSTANATPKTEANDEWSDEDVPF
jgi:hypothetical protein